MAQRREAGGSEIRPQAAPRRRARRGVRVLAAVCGVGLVAFVLGFVQFAQSIAEPPAAQQPAAADGIVVFTGGPDRISGALALLADGVARRLLISGVHPRTTKAALARVESGHDGLFHCCVDLGRTARDTVGNADETAAWARRHGFTSLIIVTSGYHMERSLTELARAMPEAKLIGHAIATPSLDLAHWWREPGAARVLLSEYVKLLAARSRALVAGTHARASGAG